MSLILGVFSIKKKINKEEFAEVFADFSLHGKRQLEFFYDENIILATALGGYEKKNIAINEAGSVVSILSGELYDVKEGVKSLQDKGCHFVNDNNPAEYALRAYEVFGSGFSDVINGNFGLAILDKAKRELTLMNDSFGTYPLFYYFTPHLVIFSTEYEPIARYKKFDKSLDYDAIAEFYTLGSPLGNKTFFKNIINLSPGSIMKIMRKKAYAGFGRQFFITKNENYDDLNIRINHQDSIDDFARDVSVSLQKAAQRRINDPEEITADLTGGADSRLLIGLLDEKQRQQVDFETLGSPWLEDDNNRDVILAGRLAKKYNLNHRVISKTIRKNVTEFSGGWFDWRRVKLREKKRLSGLGGGFIGNSAFSHPPIPIDKITPDHIRESLQNIFSDSFRNKTSCPFTSLQNEIRNIQAENSEMLFQFIIYMRGVFTNLFGGTRAGYHDPYSFLTRGDTIFYDVDLLKVLLTIPEIYMADRQLYVTMYKNHFSELLDVPTTRPDLNPIKEGKNPYHNRKQPYGKALKEYLESNEIWERDFYNREYIESISGKEKHPVLMAFIDFETWYKKYVI